MMTPATEKQTLAGDESTSPLAQRLDLLLQYAITTEQFEADMVRACRADPEEIWTLLALLDQYHRLESLPTALFRSLKASADRHGLVRREPYIPNLSAKPRAPVNTPAATPPAASAVISTPAGSPPPANAAVSTPVTSPPPASAATSTPPAPTRHAASPPASPEPITATRLAAPPAKPDPAFGPAPFAFPIAPKATVAPGPFAFALAPDRAAAPDAGASPMTDRPAPGRTLEIGSVVGGRYRIDAEFESDDRGRNFQAMDQQHAGQPAAVCQVAVHCMQPEPAEFEAVLAERRAEFQLAQPLTHPNVLSVRELDQDGVYIYLTMNLMRGETLGALLTQRRGKALARSAAYAIIRDIGAALTYTHAHGVVHGNLQPLGVLISPAGELRVRGFGAQRASSSYASCEQLEDRPSDRRDDLYALACISYELLQGSHPFSFQNASTARGRGMTPARPIQLTGRQWRALRLGLAWRREGRNLSIAQWLARMHLSGASKRLPMLDDLMAMPPPRRSWAAAVLVVGCLVAAVIFGVSLYQSPGMVNFTEEWNGLRAQLSARLHPAIPVSAPATPAPPPVAAAPASEAAPPIPAAPAPVPKAPPVAAAPAPAPQSTPPVASVTVPQSAAVPAPVPRSTPPTAAIAAPKPVPAPPPAASVRAPGESAAKPAIAAAPAAGASDSVARIELSAEHYTLQPGDSAAHILVRRSGGTRAEARFVWWTENASASADLDFVAWGRRVERIPAGQGSITLLVPIIKDATRNTPRSFSVIIGEAGAGARLGGITRAEVLIPGKG